MALIVVDCRRSCPRGQWAAFWYNHKGALAAGSFWTAAIHRRFGFVPFWGRRQRKRRKKKSGGESPQSKIIPRLNQREEASPRDPVAAGTPPLLRSQGDHDCPLSIG